LRTLFSGDAEDTPISAKPRDFVSIGVGTRGDFAIQKELIFVGAVGKPKRVDIEVPPTRIRPDKGHSEQEAASAKSSD
jgi:hypothetical protein